MLNSATVDGSGTVAGEPAAGTATASEPKSSVAAAPTFRLVPSATASGLDMISVPFETAAVPLNVLAVPLRPPSRCRSWSTSRFRSGRR